VTKLLAGAAAVLLLASHGLGEGREFELRGVEMELTDGSRLFGYVPWHALNAEEAEMSFPAATNSRDTILLYTDLRTVLYPDSGLLVCTTPLRRIARDSIHRMHEQPGRHDRYANTDIPLVSESTAALLRTPPLAMASGGDDSTRFYWLSYSPGVTAQDLEALLADPTVDWTESDDLLDRGKVIRLKFALE
jgi:hypothetical protein